MSNKLIVSSVAVGIFLLLGTAPLSAQSPRDSVVQYQREVFEYSREARPDPFRSLLQDPQLGLRLEDLSLVGVLHDGDPSRSVAILAQVGSTRRLRVRIGERIGSVRVLAIGTNTVDVLVEEFGVTRRNTLELKTTVGKGGTS